MKIFFAFLLSLASLSVQAHSKDTTTADVQLMAHPAYVRHSVIAGVSLGMVDLYRRNYNLPAGFHKNNTSGLAPVFLRLEYALGNRVGLVASLGYDAFIYNFAQEYVGYGGPFVRNRANSTRIFSGGLSAAYHFGYLLHCCPRLDPFVSAGLTLDNIRYSAYPQGDSLLTRFEHTASPILKAGVRYYISDHFSLYGDAGYDKQAIVSLGFSCRFFSRSKGE